MGILRLYCILSIENTSWKRACFKKQWFSSIQVEKSIMSMACLVNKWVGLLPWQRTWENETPLNSPHNSCMHETSESADEEDGTSLDNALWMMMDSDGITFQNDVLHPDILCEL